LREMAEAVRKTASAVLIDKYAQKTALRLGVSPEAVRLEFKKVPATRPAPAGDEEESFAVIEAETVRPSAHEFHLLKLILLYDDLVGWAALHLDPDWLSHPHVRQIVRQRLAAQADETWQSLGAFLDACDLSEMRSLITEVVAEDRKIPDPERQIAETTAKIKTQHFSKRVESQAMAIEPMEDKRQFLQSLKNIEKQIAKIEMELISPLLAAEQKSSQERRLKEMKLQAEKIRKYIE
jgi:hypothetical protein